MSKWNSEAAAKRIVKGLDARLREAGDQWLVKAGGKTVASVMARKGFVRIDLKQPLSKKDTPKGVVYVTAAKVSKSWPGGGAKFTEEHEAQARLLIERASAEASGGRLPPGG